MNIIMEHRGIKFFLLLLGIIILFDNNVLCKKQTVRDGFKKLIEFSITLAGRVLDDLVFHLKKEKKLA